MVVNNRSYGAIKFHVTSDEYHLLEMPISAISFQKKTYDLLYENQA